MRLSQLFFASLRDDPAEAEMASHRLLVRAGYVRQLGAGIYSDAPEYQPPGATEAGIDGGLFRDLYISLGESLESGDWSVRVYHRPFVRWIWLGAIFMALGGILAAGDRRYRVRVEHKRAAAMPGTAAADPAAP